jgi:hypothetical protein
MQKPKQFSFIAELVKGERGGVGIYFPLDVEKEFGRKGMIKIHAFFDGEPYRGSLAPMGGGKHMLLVKKEIRQKINKEVGDRIKVVIIEDLEERVVEIPEEFQKLLNENPEAKKNYDSMSYTHRKEYARWIAEAKKEDTRRRRLEKAIEMIFAKKKFS